MRALAMPKLRASASGATLSRFMRLLTRRTANVSIASYSAPVLVNVEERITKLLRMPDLLGEIHDGFLFSLTPSQSRPSKQYALDRSVRRPSFAT